MRVLVTGMGGELGTRVAQILEERDDVDEIVGVDYLPPRRRLRRSEFRRIDPLERERITEFVTEVAPQAIIHVGVYEPHARCEPGPARERTEAMAVNALGAAARAGTLERLVVRSGIEVYGRGRGRAAVPDEDVPVAPTTPFGRSCLETESIAASAAHTQSIPVTAVRLAPVVGSHVPSPLGRVLRLPIVPVPALADPAFSLVSPDDAARALVSALGRDHDGALNVVGSGAASPWQAVRLGARIPFPVLGAGWSVACRVAEVAGAPIPPHVAEMLCKGRTADGSRAREVLALGELRSTQEICVELFEWATVTRLRPSQAAA
ncbi:MAG TPA: NAD-dependent epimerase/dehydratase family protein [Acidimicrobiia bacterium]|nr:NAD-dependent epimerase/dehydratase family protein [Acidimicrobiia bacterium]